MNRLQLLLFSMGLLLFAPKEIQATCRAVYIVNQNNDTISVIDLATNATLSTIAVGAGTAPREIAFTPDKTRAYVSNQGGDSVAVIDPASNTVIATIPLGVGITAVGIAASSTHVYVVGNASSDVYVIDIASNTLIATIPVPSGSLNDVAVTQDETRLYITSGAGFVEIMDIPSNVLLAPVAVGANPQGVAMTALNAYVANQASNDVSIIDLATLAVTTPVVVIPFAQDIAITPDGTKAYVTSAAGPDTLYIFDIATNTVSGTIPLPAGGTPSYQVSVTPDGTKVYVTHNSINTMSIVDVATNAITTPVISPALSGPFGIGFSCSDLVSGACKKDVFLTQIDLINQISWSPILSSVPVQYKIFRNGELIGVVSSSGPLQFEDHNRKKKTTDVYFVYAETSNSLSLVGVVLVKSCK